MLIVDSAKLLRIVRVKPEEAQLVGLVFLFALLIGIVQNFMYSVPLAMFLARYKSELLPYIYISAGIVTFIVSTILAYFGRIFSIFLSLVIPLAVLSCSLILFFVLLISTEIAWISMALLIWSWVVALLLTGIAGVLFNQIFTLQQGKRLLGLLAGGIAAGGIIAGFSVDFLMHAIGANYVIFGSAMILISAIGVLFAITKHSFQRGRQNEASDESQQRKVSLKNFQNKSYIFYVFLLSAIVNFMYFSFDLLFNTEVQKKFSNEIEMAGFYGIVFAIYDIVTLFAGLFLSGWILQKFGLFFSLMVLPLTLSLLLGAAFLADLVPSAAGVVFALVVITGILENAARESINEESVLLLFQPLRASHRAWVQMKNEISVTPLAISLAGGFLLLIGHYFQIHVSNMSLIVIGFCVLNISLTFFILKKGYLKLLIDSFSKKILTGLNITKLDIVSLNSLKKHLLSPYPEEVVYLLQILENIDRKEFVNTLQMTLDNCSLEVRGYSLMKIEQYRIKDLEEKVRKICLTEKNAEILSDALLALGSIVEPNHFSLIQGHMEDAIIEVASSSMIALLRYGPAALQDEVMQNLISRAGSSKDEDKICFALVLKQFDIPNKPKLLLPLFKDQSLKVRLAACQAAMHTNDRKLYPALIDHLMVSYTSYAAQSSLLSMGDALIEYISLHFDAFSFDLQYQLIKVLGFMKKSARVANFLHLFLKHPERRLFSITLMSLKRQSYKASTDQERSQIKELLLSETQNIDYLKELLNYFNSEKMRLLYLLLSREIELIQGNCFLMLTFIYPEHPIMTAMKGLSMDNEEMVSYAIEILFEVLDPIDKRLWMPYLIFRPSSMRVETENVEEVKNGLVNVLKYAQKSCIPALSSAAIYTIGALQLKSMIHWVLNYKATSDPFINEIVPWTIKKLDSSVCH